MAFEMPTGENPVSVVEGDCLSVLQALPDGCVDAVITDPPYGISLSAHAANECMDGSPRNRVRDWTIAGDKDLEVAQLVLNWCESNRLPLCAFASLYRPLPGEWRNILIWNKGPAVGGGGDPHKCWKRTAEAIYVRGNGDLREGRHGAVLDFFINTGSDFEFHPCQKPVPLMRYLIRQLTAPGDLILDPFAGSGTTGVAAALEGRRAVLCELNPEYAKIARDRVAKVLDRGLFA